MTTNNNHQDDNTLNLMKIENDKNSKELIRNSLQKMVGSALDEETREVTMRIEEERQKAVKILVEENRSAIKAIVEEGKKVIRMRSQAGLTLGTFRTDYIEKVIEHVYDLMEVTRIGTAPEMPVNEASTNSTNVTKIKSVELEILPPRDQNAIEAIHGYLTSIPHVSAVELITMVDKSIFRVTTNENVDFLGKLQSLPQVLEVIPIRDNGHEHIQITLMAKAKLVKSQEEMDAKVKKIFHGKN